MSYSPSMRHTSPYFWQLLDPQVMFAREKGCLALTFDAQQDCKCGVTVSFHDWWYTETHSSTSSPRILSFCTYNSYCQNGTKTSDPFRNDTTLRPYACTPGTYCFAGTGSNEVRENIIGFAQPCHAGFFCEAASTSAKGSGACPPSFECPKGTANPRPTPKGFHAEHPGTIESTACLPGFYAPTIQTDKCYECPVSISAGDFMIEICSSAQIFAHFIIPLFLYHQHSAGDGMFVWRFVWCWRVWSWHISINEWWEWQ